MTNTIFDLIDRGSFSSLWYWLALATGWSLVTWWGIGVPFDMVARARRAAARHPAAALPEDAQKDAQSQPHEAASQGAAPEIPSEAARELVALTRVLVARKMRLWAHAGVAVTALAFALLGLLAMLGFFYGIEFAQAFLLFAAPLGLAALMAARVARDLAPRLADPQAAVAPLSAEIVTALVRLRRNQRMLGFAAITLIGLWGMVHNLRMAFGL